MKKRLRGSITVFAALSFMLVASLICSLIESVRVQGARAMVAIAENLALDSLFAAYERELLEQYGVLLFDGGAGDSGINKDVLEQKIYDNMAYNLQTDKNMLTVKGHDFYGVVIDDISIDRIITAPEAYGLVWRRMINDYAGINYSAELLESILGIQKQDEENKKIQAAAEYVDDCCETASNIEYDYLELIEHLDGIKTGASGIDFNSLRVRNHYVKKLCVITADQITPEKVSINNETVYSTVVSDMFDAAAFFGIFLGKYEEVLFQGSSETDDLISLSEILRSFFSGLEQENNHCMRLIERIQAGQEDLASKIVSASEYIGSITDIRAESLAGLAEEFEQVYRQNEAMQERFSGLEDIYKILAKNGETAEEIMKLCPDIQFMSNKTGDSDGQKMRCYDAYKEAAKLLYDYRTDGMYLDYTGLACREGDESILGCVYDYVQSGICGLVLPEGGEVSQKKLPKHLELADLYGIRGDRGESIEDMAADIINEALFNIYIGDCFECYTDTDGQGMLDYEQEFIMFGKNSDKENLTKAITAIAGIRFACNLAYIYTNSQKKQEAYNVALAALGFTGIMALVKVLQYVILSAWAIGETVVDLKFLMRGDSVPLIKKKEQWYLSLDRLLSGELSIGGEEKKEGLGYNQYLACAMLFADSQDKAYRSMAVAEMHMISAGVENFRLKNYIYGVEISTLYHIGNGKKQYIQKCSYTY